MSIFWLKLSKINMDATIIRGLSLNISGLNNSLKRRRIYNMLKRELIDIICLQETHGKRRENI